MPRPSSFSALLASAIAVLGLVAGGVARAGETPLDVDASGSPGTSYSPSEVFGPTRLDAPVANGKTVLFYDGPIWSGFFSIYEGYRVFASLLTDRGYAVDAHYTVNITAADLDGIDVLVVPLPIRPFPASEVAAVVDFVARGGGLFLIADYAESVSSPINSIARHYDITAHPGFVLDPTNHDEYPGVPIIHVFGRHPIVDGLGSVPLPATGYQTLGATSPAIGIAFSDGDSTPPNVPVMVATPACASERIVLIGDGTVFGGSLSRPGARQLALNTIDWLAGLLPESCLEIDVKPGTDHNAVNPMARGVVPVAILGSETVDVMDVQPESLAFGPAGAGLAHRNCPHFADVNGDGFSDLVAHFAVEDTGIAFGDPEACLSGEFDGRPFDACDSIVTVPACGLGFELAALLPPLMWLRRGRRFRWHIGWRD